MHKFINKSLITWLALSIVIFVTDIYTKHLIQQSFSYGEHLPITRFFDLVRFHNTGAAFSFLANAGGWQHWFLVIISLTASLFIIYLLIKHNQNTQLCTGLAMVLGGAIGNLYDRLTLGYVVDFLYFFYQGWAWPAFNVADSAICIGVALLLLDSFRQESSKQNSN